MRLIELSCDSPTFHTISFNREGLTLIIGDGTYNKTNEGSSNGVGKTLALGLVHHCLGAKADPRLVDAVPRWEFSLLFEIQGKEHHVLRSGDGKRIVLDGNEMSQASYRRWLDGSGVFNLDASVPSISFRALV